MVKVQVGAWPLHMGRIWMEGEGMLYSRTSMSKSEEPESWWVFTWPEERVYGEEYVK